MYNTQSYKNPMKLAGLNIEGLTFSVLIES